MIPHADTALRMLSQRLLTQVAPDARTSYSASDGMILGLLMNAVAEDLGEGIERRCVDITEMRGLLARGQRFYEPANVAEPASLKLADVDRCRDALTRELIQLQAAIETMTNKDAEALASDIWRYLEDSTRRHAIQSVP